ncbi:hypothetical protein F2Q69_00018747 [Brassica cretica]|uniref:Major facilitator superfamily protein n=1 Tax=Brassica cretica TaxID=69181 RepID=A0A8S9Q9D6_BRACR|nr:hypothetical protein F2Q69_00018747 [Brassica cretica]
MAYFGLSVNMVAFMFYVMHRPFESSSNAVNNFLGISQASSVLGGFLADAYLGRYRTIAIFTTMYLLGLIGITLGASLKMFVPDQSNCDQLSLLLGNCQPAKSWQMLYLYTVLYITGFGAAGIRPCVSSFGADQFDEKSKEYKTHLDRFFNFFYLSVTLGAIIAFTLVVYVQMEHGWGMAFGTLAIAMAISNALFFAGTPLYRHRLPGGSPLTRVAQVLVAAFRKRGAAFTSSEFIGLYEVSGLKWLDKAALHLKEDGLEPSPWKLCTVTQVEEVKILIRLIPIPACTVMLSLVLTEYLTLSVQQAYTLNTHIQHLKLPVTCMPVFPGLSIFLILSLYYSVFVPITRRITGNPHGASQLQRVGIGLAVSIISVAWAGLFENYRRHYAIQHGFEFNFLTQMPDLTAYWLLIQYCLIGIAEVFCIVGLLEFLYEEAPDAMKSIGSAYAALAGGWLDKAALHLKEDGLEPSPWKLCTVTQVEEVKILIRLIPIPACTVMLSLVLTEYLTLSVQQAYTLNTHIQHLKLPVTCMPVFPGLSIFLILSLYYSVFVPITRRITGNPHGASQLQRVGIGLAVSIISVAWAGLFENYRRHYAIQHGFEFNFLTQMPDLTAYWLLIQYCLIGIAEVFCIVGLLEFLYEEAPDAMKSIGSAYAALAGGLGCFAATTLNNIVKAATRNSDGNSWLSQNINTGRFDCLYWLLTLLSLLNFCVFLWSAHRYKYRAVETEEDKSRAYL